MSRPVVIVDCETTGLDPQRDQIWELALIDRTTGSEYLWRMQPDLAKADPQALRVGQYYDRTLEMCTRCHPDRTHDLAQPTRTGDLEWSDPDALAVVVARLLDDVILVAANPAFDAGFLAAFLRANGQAPTWHYRLRDMGSMAYGWLCQRPGQETPPIDASTDEFAHALGVDPNQFERHSALGDCHLLSAMLDAMTGETS